jgi:hypothetical protein
MSVFPDWQKYAVHQRNPETGCIPTSYEMVLRARGVGGIDYGTFQEDFDFGVASHFGPVAEAIRQKYAYVDFRWVEFKTGDEKLAFIENRLSRKEITIVSLAKSPNGRDGWHIMPIVDADATHLYLFNYMAADGTIDVRPIAKTEFTRRHDEWDGGKELAFLADQAESGPVENDGA